MILGVHHPALSVPDLEKALAFYRDKLGFEAVMSAEIPSGVPFLNEAFGVPDAGCKVAMLKRGNSCIEIFEFQGRGSLSQTMPSATAAKARADSVIRASPSISTRGSMERRSPMAPRAVAQAA